jgi:hypothetical protein
MSKLATKPAVLRESWRPDSNTDLRGRRLFQFRRIAFLCLLGLLSIVFSYLLFSPFFHPTTRLYFLTAGSYDRLDVQPVPYFREDAIRFLSVDGPFRRIEANNEFFLLESPEACRASLQQIASAISEPSDVVLVSLSAHPALISGRPYLQCGNADHSNPTLAAISMEEVLDLLARVTAGTTLLLLDIGPKQERSLVGAEQEEFIYSVQDLMKKSKSSSVWLMLSNSPNESSYSSSELRASVFSYAISQGLQGKADLNEDKAIDLEEFYRYVVSFTGSTIDRNSGGVSKQTPLLFATEVNQVSDASSRLIASVPEPVNKFSWTSMIPGWSTGAETNESDEADPKPSETKEAVEKKEKEKNWLTAYWEKKSARASEMALDELDDNINFLPSFIAKRVKKTIGTEVEPVSDDATPDKKGDKDAASPIGDPGENSSLSPPAEEPLDSPPPPNQFNRTSLPDLSNLGNPKQTNAELIQLAWQYADFFEEPSDSLTRPLDLAPLAWRSYLNSLHGIEERHRKDAVVDSKELRVKLLSEIIGSLQLATTNRASVGPMIKSLAEQIPSIELPVGSVPSFALLERFSHYGGPPIPDLLRRQMQLMDEAVLANDQELYDKWLSQLPAEVSNQYWEFFVPKLLSLRPAMNWQVKRRLLTQWRQLERLTFDPLNSNSQIQQDLIAANRLMLQSTRLACDQFGADWESRCLKILDSAEQSLVSAAQKLAQIQTAIQLRNKHLNNLPALLQWREIAIDRFGTDVLDEDVAVSIQALSKISSLLLNRETCDLNELKRYQRQLVNATSRIEGFWNREANDVITGSQKKNVAPNWIVDFLLSTSLVRGPNRNRLIVLTIPSPTTPTEEKVIATSLPKLPSRETAEISQIKHARFVNEVAHLAELGLEPPFFKRDHAVVENGQVEALDPEAHRIQIETFYQNLPSRIRAAITEQADAKPRDSDSLKTRLKRLRIADHCTRLMHAENANNLDSKSSIGKLWSLEFSLCLRSKKNLVREMLRDAVPEEVPFIRNAIDRFAFIESELSGISSGIAEATDQQTVRLQSRGTTSLSLISDPTVIGEIVWKNLGKPISNAWLLVDYDSELLEVESTSGQALNRVGLLPQLFDEGVRDAEQQWITALASVTETKETDDKIEIARKRLDSIRSSQQYPVQPIPSILKPSLGMALGQEVALPFRVRRIGKGPEKTTIVWKLVSDGAYQRFETTVQLPAPKRIRLKSEGPGDTWSETEEGIVLFPWPNRTTDFRIGLSNESGETKVLSIDLFACLENQSTFLPDGFLNDEISNRIADRIGELEKIASVPELTLNEGTSTQWLPILDAAGRVPQGTKAPVASDSPTGDGSASIHHGIVVVLTDKKTNEKCWRRIDCRIRHPRSYLEPTVRYDAVSERITMRFKSSNGESLFSDGIPVKARIREPLPRGTEMKLEGTVIGRDELELYCQVPETAPRVLTMEVDVDGYPRAYVFEVPCWQTKTNIPLSSDLQRIEIVEPSPGTSIGPESKSQSVILKIDAIPGAFDSRGDSIEVGWDLDRDREFANEQTTKFTSDRHADIGLSTSPVGRLLMSAKVSDIHLELSTPAIKKGRVNLLAKLNSGGRIVWSDPVEIISDSDPPTISGVELLPGPSLAQGMDLTVRVGADDANLSGVVMVEVLLDSNGAGTFEASGGRPKATERQPDGSWLALLPTKEISPGRATLLVRATDRAGNKSLVTKSSIEIVSKQEWDEKQKTAVQELSGSVTYSDDPMTNAKVWLENEKGETAYSTTTNERGAFRFANVQTGKYKLIALGVVKNRPRKAERPIEVLPPPAPVARVRLQAK